MDDAIDTAGLGQTTTLAALATTQIGALSGLASGALATGPAPALFPAPAPPVAQTSNLAADLTTAAEVAAAVIEAAPAGPVAAALAGIEAWFMGSVPNTAISRDTTAHNRIINAVSEIKSALASIKE